MSEELDGFQVIERARLVALTQRVTRLAVTVKTLVGVLEKMELGDLGRELERVNALALAHEALEDRWPADREREEDKEVEDETEA